MRVRRTAIVTMPTIGVVVISSPRWTLDAVVTVGTMHTQEVMVGIYIFTLRRFRIFVPYSFVEMTQKSYHTEARGGDRHRGPCGDTRVDVENGAVVASGGDGCTDSTRGKFGGVVMAIKHVVAAWLGTGSRHDGSLGWSAGGVDQGCNRDIRLSVVMECYAGTFSLRSLIEGYGQSQKKLVRGLGASGQAQGSPKCSTLTSGRGAEGDGRPRRLDGSRGPSGGKS